MTEIFQIEARIAVNSGAIDKICNKELEHFSQQGRVPRIDQGFPKFKHHTSALFSLKTRLR